MNATSLLRLHRLEDDTEHGLTVRHLFETLHAIVGDLLGKGAILRICHEELKKCAGPVICDDLCTFMNVVLICFE